MQPGARQSWWGERWPHYFLLVWPGAFRLLSLSLSFSILKTGLKIPMPYRTLCDKLESPGHPIKAAIIVITILNITLPKLHAPQQAIMEPRVLFNKAQLV